MADNNKYYYLKLKDNFFDSDTMIILESMPDGYLYSNILLKLYLRSLKKIEIIKEKTGVGYCPCFPQHTKDTVCPCKYMRTMNVCRCGRLS